MTLDPLFFRTTNYWWFWMTAYSHGHCGNKLWMQLQDKELSAHSHACEHACKFHTSSLSLGTISKGRNLVLSCSKRGLPSRSMALPGSLLEMQTPRPTTYLHDQNPHLKENPRRLCAPYTWSSAGPSGDELWLGTSGAPSPPWHFDPISKPENNSQPLAITNATLLIN